MSRGILGVISGGTNGIKWVEEKEAAKQLMMLQDNRPKVPLFKMSDLDPCHQGEVWKDLEEQRLGEGVCGVCVCVCVCLCK
jgi:hypothetical protein